MENIVIKSENPEMGKNIIKYFKDMGIDTQGYQGFNTERLLKGFIYYGVINDVFGNYTLEQIEEWDAKIITLPVIFKRGDKVQVWVVNEDFYRSADFVAYIEGAFFPYFVTDDINKNNFCINSFLNCKHDPQKVKLTLQQIADKFSIDVDLIEIV